MSVERIQVSGVTTSPPVRSRRLTTPGVAAPLPRERKVHIVNDNDVTRRVLCERGALDAGMDDDLSEPSDPSTPLVIVEPRNDRMQSPADAGAHAGPAIFNEVELLGRVFGDASLMGDVIRVFLDDFPARLAEIGDALRREDPEALRLAAHALRGAAGNISATDVMASALVLEQMGTESRMDAAEGAWRKLAGHADRLIDELRSRVDQSAAEPLLIQPSALASAAVPIA